MKNPVAKKSLYLIVTLGALLLVFLIVYALTNQGNLTASEDSIKGRTLIDDSRVTSVEPGDPDMKVALYVGQDTLDKGLKGNEFMAIQRYFGNTMHNIYGSRYSTGIIDDDSVKYNEEQNQFTMQIQLGERDSPRLKFDVIFKRTRFNYANFTITDHAGKEIANSTEKVNLNF